MRLPFRRRNTTPLGVDIGENSIKLLRLEKAGDSRATHVARVATPPGTWQDGTPRDEALLGETLGKLVAGMGLEGSKAATAVGGRGFVTHRMLNIPVIPDAEIPSAVRWEAERYLKMDDIVMDYVNFGSVEVQGQPQFQVMVVAVDRQAVESLQRVFAAARLNLVLVDDDVLALWRGLMDYASENGATLYLNVGASCSILAICNNKWLRFTRVVSFGTSSLANWKNGSSLFGGMSAEQEAAVALEELSPVELEMALAASTDELVSDLKRSLDFHVSQNGGETVDRLVLSGGGANIPGLEALLSSELGVDVTRALLAVEAPQKVDDGLYASPGVLDPSFALALGLARSEVKG